jgi:4-hydroxybenzoate polyprenyltransferase
MLGIQAAIGALNDLVDAPRDAGRKPGKPIPAGVVAPAEARLVVAVAAAGGLGISLPSGVPAFLVGGLILAIGAAYDLRLKGTPWSWLPFAAGIPLLPVYAWIGATGMLPAPFAVLLPAAFLAGAALAIANALVDVERDRDAGITSIAAHLGQVTAWRLHAALHAGVLALATASLDAWGRPPEITAAVVGAPALLLAGGARLALAGSVGRRERGWELEVLAIAVLAGTWLQFGVPR